MDLFPILLMVVSKDSFEARDFRDGDILARIFLEEAAGTTTCEEV